jgi:Kef-type K+ transport system membrane component KefB
MNESWITPHSLEFVPGPGSARVAPDVSFTGLAIVSAVAFVVPLVIGLAPRVRLPSVVVEIVAGILIGPAGFGWVKPDLPIKILALIGLAFVLFLAGLEIDLDRLRGRVLRITGAAFAASFGIALLVAYSLRAAGQVQTPLIIAIILVATSLGIIIPLVKDVGQISSEFGQLVVAAGSIGDFGAIILLTLFFSREAKGTGSQLVLLGTFAFLAAAVTIAITRAERSMVIAPVLLRLQDTTAQIRVRGAFLLLVLFAALAETLGLEVILGAFMAGAILTIVDRDQMMTHPEFWTKLEVIGSGIFIPIFFINSGLNFNLAALFAGPSTVARVPLFFLAILAVRGLAALRHVLLMIFFGSVEGGRRGNLRYNLSSEASSWLPFILGFPSNHLLLRRVEENGGSILAPDVEALPIPRCGIVTLPEHLE